MECDACRYHQIYSNISLPHLTSPPQLSIFNSGCLRITRSCLLHCRLNERQLTVITTRKRTGRFPPSVSVAGEALGPIPSHSGPTCAAQNRHSFKVVIWAPQTPAIDSAGLVRRLMDAQSVLYAEFGSSDVLENSSPASHVGSRRALTSLRANLPSSGASPQITPRLSVFRISDQSGKTRRPDDYNSSGQMPHL